MNDQEIHQAAMLAAQAFCDMARRDLCEYTADSLGKMVAAAYVAARAELIENQKVAS